jgi:SAM-dependent methyltransferase
MQHDSSMLIKQGIATKHWLFSPLGSAFLEQEKKEVSSLIDSFEGEYILNVGEEPFLAGTKGSKITNKLWIDLHAFAVDEGFSIVGRADKLPITNDKIDLVYLAHCLGSSKNPHEMLRESYRVLVPEGHIIISGFNPWSLWGLKRLFGPLVRYWPWNSHFLSVLRLKDWLALLGFEIISTHFYFFRPPMSMGLKKMAFLESLGRFGWPMFGGHYVILAKKRVIPLTLVRPSWQQEKVGAAEAEPGLWGPAVRNG